MAELDNKFNTKYIEINGNNLAETCALASEIFKSGELVAFPTETVYGLGANALDGEACKKIYQAKGRPSDNPLIIHVAYIFQVEKYAYVTDMARKVMETFCPGPLTVVLKKKDIIPNVVSGGRDTVAVRIPVHKTAHAILEKVGLPIAAPSANLSGRPSPTCGEHVLEDMNGRIPLIISDGFCNIGLESTIVDLTSEFPRILRPGAITQNDLEKVCGKVDYYKGVVGTKEAPLAPGMKYRHYAPKGEVFLLAGEELENAVFNCKEKYALLITKQTLAKTSLNPNEKNIYILGNGNDLEEIAKHIFAGLRFADTIGAEKVFVENPATLGKGGIEDALMNRLNKAACKK